MSASSGARRDYAPVRAALHDIEPNAARSLRMRRAVDAIWDHLGGTEIGTRCISWIGFYAIEGEQMVLLERRDTPACSPITLDGACGRSWRKRTTLIVDDVHTLGEAYIACDPRDRSELVIPCVDESSVCWGVLDADSFDACAFDAHDASEMAGLLRLIGLSHRDAPVCHL